MAQRAGRVGLRDLRRRDRAATRSRRSRRSCSRTRTARRSSSARSRRRSRPRRIVDQADRRVPHAAKASAGTSTITRLFHGIERFFRSSYVGNLVQSWIPALDGVEAKLEAGAYVADIGCGHGASTILMAQAFPAVASSSASTITRNRSPRRTTRARKAGVAERCRFEVASAKDFPGKGYDFVCRVRRAARHGRSGRRVAARALDARSPRAAG